MAKAMIRRLRRLIDDPSDVSWSISRVFWRVGQLNLKEAAPYLIRLQDAADTDMKRYTYAWALGRCGKGNAKVAAILRGFLQDEKKIADPKVKRITSEAYLATASETGRTAFINQLAESLPDWLREDLPYLNAEELSARIEEMTPRVTVKKIDAGGTETHRPTTYLHTLYLVSHNYPAAREAILQYARSAPLTQGRFRELRHLYKASEFRGDYSLFAQLLYRFEKQSGRYSPAYTYGTRESFRRKCVRWLRLLVIGEQVEEYTNLATEILLQFSDDQDSNMNVLINSYSEASCEVINYLNDVTFYEILYANSSRYRISKSWNKSWKSSLNYKIEFEEITTAQGEELNDLQNKILVSPIYDHQYAVVAAANQPLSKEIVRSISELGVEKIKVVDVSSFARLHDSAEREEAYPVAWDRAPHHLLRLLRESCSLRVHQFASKAFRANPQFVELTSTSDLIQFFSKTFEITHDLALHICDRIYDPNNPSIELVRVMLGAHYTPTLSKAIQWIKENTANFIAHTPLLVDILFTSNENVQTALQPTLEGAILNLDKQQTLAEAVIDRLVGFKNEEDEAEREEEISRRAGELLIKLANEHLKSISFDKLIPLLLHSLKSNQALAARILKNHSTPASGFPLNIWSGLFDCQDEYALKLATELFGELSDEVLLDKAGVVMQLCLSPHQSLRQGMRPIMSRLTARDESFAREALDQCYPLMLRKEAYEGLHEDILALIDGPFAAHLDHIPSEHIARMFRSRYIPTKSLGWKVFQSKSSLDNITMLRVAALGDNALLEVREAVWEYYETHLPRVKNEMEDACRILDTQWDDTRNFAIPFFREKLEEADWSPSLLVAVCDKPNPEVQSFGRELVTRYFNENHGTEYLLKLSEHPTIELQAFASDYLERYATRNLEHITALEPYFTTVLSRVNKGRIAKARVLKFLANESQQSPDIAKVWLRILTRQVVTVAIGDKAACMQTLLAILNHYPELENPLSITSPPLALVPTP